VHQTVVKRIFRYPKGTITLALCYKTREKFSLQGYCRLHWGRMERNSIRVGCHFVRGNMISWISKKHGMIALSRTEAEYVSAAQCSLNCYG